MCHSFSRGYLCVLPSKYVRTHRIWCKFSNVYYQSSASTHSRSICLQNAPASQPTSNATEWQNLPSVTMETKRPNSMSTCLGVIPMSGQATWLLLLLLETETKVFAAVVWWAVCIYRSTLTVSFSSSSVDGWFEHAWMRRAKNALVLGWPQKKWSGDMWITFTNFSNRSYQQRKPMTHRTFWKSTLELANLLIWNFEENFEIHCQNNISEILKFSLGVHVNWAHFWNQSSPIWTKLWGNVLTHFLFFVFFFKSSEQLYLKVIETLKVKWTIDVKQWVHENSLILRNKPYGNRLSYC